MSHWREVLLASHGWKPRGAAETLQCLDTRPQQTMTQEEEIVPNIIPKVFMGWGAGRAERGVNVTMEARGY